MLAVNIDVCGHVAFGAVIRQRENAAKIAAPDQDADDEYEVEATTAWTEAALLLIIDARLSAMRVRPASVPGHPAADDGVPANAMLDRPVTIPVCYSASRRPTYYLF